MLVTFAFENHHDENKFWILYYIFYTSSLLFLLNHEKTSPVILETNQRTKQK